MEIIPIILYGISAFAWGYLTSHYKWSEIDKEQTELHKLEIELYKKENEMLSTNQSKTKKTNME